MAELEALLPQLSQQPDYQYLGEPAYSFLLQVHSSASLQLKKTSNLKIQKLHREELENIYQDLEQNNLRALNCPKYKLIKEIQMQFMMMTYYIIE